MLGSVILAMVGDLVELQHRAKAMGIVMIGFSGAAGLGVPTGIHFATLTQLANALYVSYCDVFYIACIMFFYHPQNTS